MNKKYLIIISSLCLVIILLTIIIIMLILKEPSKQKEVSSKIMVEEKNTTEEEKTSRILEEYNYDSDEILTSNDRAVINYFGSAKDEIKDYYNNNKLESLKEKGKVYFVMMVDFLFYDKDINGIYLRDLSDSTKNLLYNIFKDIDSVIVKVYPEYKSDFSDQYDIMKDTVSETYNLALDKVKETIGEEEYNKIRDTKDDIKEGGKSAYEKAKDKISNWYENISE